MNRWIAVVVALTLTSSAMAIAQDTVSARNYSEPAPLPTYSRAQVNQNLREAHTPEQYQALAEYYRGQQQALKERARDEWSEAVRRSQFFWAGAKAPTARDSWINRYQYFSHKSRQMEQKVAYFEKLSEGAQQ